MPKAGRRQKKQAEASQDDGTQASQQANHLIWTDAMIEGALDEAEQQDALGKRAGQSFKSEALLLIATAAAERAHPELNITLTIAQICCHWKRAIALLYGELRADTRANSRANSRANTGANTTANTILAERELGRK
jgi:hypothetical protein